MKGIGRGDFLGRGGHGGVAGGALKLSSFDSD
jgi:hypothetical protein